MEKKESSVTEAANVLHTLPLLAQGRAAMTLAQILPAMQDSETGEKVTASLPSVLSYLVQQTTAVKAGGLDAVEDVLLSQMLVLDALFHKSLLAAQASPSLDHHNIHMNIALKAQAQTRTTAEAIAAIKSPRTYIHQQNMAYRPNVHTGTVVQNFGSVEGREIPKSTNELLSNTGGSNAELDFGRTSAPISNDKELVSVELIDRSSHSRREDCRKDERKKTRAAKRRNQNAA